MKETENEEMIPIKPYYYMREGLLHKRVTYDLQWNCLIMK